MTKFRDQSEASRHFLAENTLVPQAEVEPIPISALQHYLFCPRQCALIHVEQLWAEDAATMEGRILHEAADSRIAESRPGVKIARGISLCSRSLGLSGRADIVEFHGTPPVPFPVEYKRGKPKSHRADEVQLCAQALCLEEMLGVRVERGALFYGERRRRTAVLFDTALRDLVAETALAVRDMIERFETPPAKYTSACERCSLKSLCKPKSFERPGKAVFWLKAQIEQSLAETA